MKTHRILIDTGPIVAILSTSDQHHERCVAELGTLHPPLWTCWPVLTEAQWLLRHDAKGIDGLFRAFETKLLALLPLDHEALPSLHTFLARYRTMKPDLADAALMYLAHREGIQTIFTLDRRDFSVYRYGRNRRLNVIPSASH